MVNFLVVEIVVVVPSKGAAVIFAGTNKQRASTKKSGKLRTPNL